MKQHDRNVDVAIDALKKGIVAVPCHPGTKVPALRTWKPWQSQLPPEDLVRAWFADTRWNLAIITTGMAVFDCDDYKQADLVLDRCGYTSHQVQTPRGGIHLGYRRRKGVKLTNQVKIKGLPIDIRTDGGIEMVPNSWTPDGEYRWTQDSEGLRPVAELPVAKIGWTRSRKRKKAVQAVAPWITDPGSLPYCSRAYGEAALRSEVQAVATAPEGTRNSTLNRAAYCLGGLVAVGLLDREVVERALFEAAITAGLGERETLATLRSGLTAGLKHPRKIGA